MAESEAPVIEVAQKATIHFTRKLPREQYGSSEFGIFLPVDLPLKTDFAEESDWYLAVDRALKDGSQLVKTLVWEQQGIQFEAVEGVLFEKLGAAFPKSTEQATSSFKPVANQQQSVSASPITPAAGERACPKCGGSMFDNRSTPEKPKRNPKAPDHKCKDRDCDGVIWPPR